MNARLTANELEAQARELADRALIQLAPELAPELADEVNTTTDDRVERQC